MRVLLIVPKGIGRYEKPTVPHAGIGYIAAMLRKYDHSVKIADMRLYPEYNYLYGMIKSFKPDIIGITTASRGYKIAYSLITRIKKDFFIPIVIGGAHASTIHEKILEECEADYSIIGEGEYTMLELVEKNDLETIKGLCWKKENKIIKNDFRPFNKELDELAFPAYELFELDKFIEKRIPIVSSRGCPFQCTYCSVKLVMGMPFRYRTPENVVQEIEYWVKKGFNQFEFTDDNFTCIKSRAEKICDMIIEKNLNITFLLGNGIRADKVDESVLRKLKQAGCVYIAYGVESINPYVLKVIKKHETPEVIEKAIVMTQRLKIPIQATFIIGLPGSTFKTFLEDLNFTRRLGISNVRFYNLVPYPGTEAYEWVEENGQFLFDPETYLNDVDYWDENPVFETPKFPKELRKKAYKIGHMNNMRLFFKEKFGGIIGSIVYKLYRSDIIRQNFFRIGKDLYMMLKRFQALHS
jgi:radical SAM superfamily enzyme YgiQ (UPF0313 family)